jgi:hypothetical protein
MTLGHASVTAAISRRFRPQDHRRRNDLRGDFDNVTSERPSDEEER